MDASWMIDEFAYAGPEPMLATAGFEIVEARFRRSVYGAYTCVRR